MEQIAGSYDEAAPKIHHLDRMPLPSREAAAAIMHPWSPAYKHLDGELSLAFDDTAEQCAYAFLESLPSIRRMLAKDIEAAYDGEPAAHCIDEIILKDNESGTYRETLL